MIEFKWQLWESVLVCLFVVESVNLYSRASKGLVWGNLIGVHLHCPRVMFICVFRVFRVVFVWFYACLVVYAG